VTNYAGSHAPQRDVSRTFSDLSQPTRTNSNGVAANKPPHHTATNSLLPYAGPLRLSHNIEISAGTSTQNTWHLHLDVLERHSAIDNPSLSSMIGFNGVGLFLPANAAKNFKYLLFK